jgi:hypothetical protein
MLESCHSVLANSEICKVNPGSDDVGVFLRIITGRVCVYQRGKKLGVGWGDAWIGL